MPELPLEKLFVLLFMMTGPLRVVPGFASISGALPPEARHDLARRGVLFAAIGVLLSVFVGHGILRSWGASPQALATATGTLLLLTALRDLTGWPAPPPPPAARPDASPGRLALSPLAFPIILPPFAVGVLVLFAAHFPDLASQGKMVGLALGLLVVDLLAMRHAERIMAALGPVALHLLGAVFGVLQLALATEMIFWGVKTAFVGG